jgi:hypothetical protein
VDYWFNGVMFARGETDDFELMAHSIGFWLFADCLSKDFQDRFPFVKVACHATAYENGREVEEKWQECFDYIPRERSTSELTPFLFEAAKHPILRQLYPFTIFSSFYFSRCTGGPYTGDCPSVTPSGDGLYVVKSPSRVTIGCGTAEVAVALVISHLPENVGPAIFGTADELNNSAFMVENP